MKSFGLCTYSHADGVHRAGLAIDGLVWAIADLAKYDPACGLAGREPTVVDLLQDWDRSLAALEKLAAIADKSDSAGRPMESLTIHAPIEYPRQIFCTGANYRKHVIDLTVDTQVGPEGLDREGLRAWAAEMMDTRARNGEPYVFTKPSSAVAGAYDKLVLPANTAKPDWEIELGVIIGKEASCVSRENAFDYIAGYAITNDITARDLIARTDYKLLGTDWLKAKGQPGFLPFGPMIVPARFVPNPENLSLRLTVSGKVMQDENTSDMLFGIARQIEYISHYARLLPGDLICTGSPAGNGTHYNRYLQPGDIMIAEIEGLGSQRVECVAANS